MATKILIADDIPEIANYFAYILKNESNFEILGTVSSGAECIKSALELKPDIILMDIQMESDDSGLISTQKIHEEMPDVKIIILAAYNDTKNILRAFEAGAVDFIEKNASLLDIVNTLKEAAFSKTFAKSTKRKIFDEMVKMKTNQKNIVLCSVLLSMLSKNDIKIIKKLCANKKYKEIAAEEFIEEVTVRSKITHISKKIGNYSIREFISMLNSCNFFGLIEQYKKDFN